MQKKKFLRYSIYGVILFFAFIGFVLTGTYVAVKLRITNDPGAVDYNDRMFKEISEKQPLFNPNDKRYIQYLNEKRPMQYLLLALIGKFYPYNANVFFDALKHSNHPLLLEQMIATAELRLANNNEYYRMKKELLTIYNKPVRRDTLKSLFAWMNISEWNDLKEAIRKDKRVIDSASKAAGVEPRLVVCCLIGEQIRLFNSKREIYKRYIGPLKVLSVESQFSLGVTGIKDFTAKAIEHNLKDSTSVFYLGKKYESLLDFQSENPDTERYYRLVNYRNHYYQYLYAALYLHQVKKQWERAGYDISNRPEILVTLYNVGFPFSIPKPDPRVGGSTITINGVRYTFGAIGFDFYYSGELSEEFPYLDKKFAD
ncbi:MAG: hypothetical protein N2449_03045 [Bacteroidales bacterium]|nr:hypothetical protein [Bacteroidales bacterium]